MLLLDYITYYNFTAKCNAVCVIVLLFDAVLTENEEDFSVRSVAKGDYVWLADCAGVV